MCSFPRRSLPSPALLWKASTGPPSRWAATFSRSSPEADGSILAIIGDVSGKGLRAAMLVSLIVGAVRTLAKFTRDPAEILRGINERLCGR